MDLTFSLENSLRSLVLLAPAQSPVPEAFRRVSHNFSLYRSLQSEMQRLRGRLYLSDGAITSFDLSDDDRHILPVDDQSWHLLTMAADGSVAGCTRYLLHNGDARFDDLGLRTAALATCDKWGGPLRNAVEQELRRARAERFSYVEVGGWAMDPSVRGTPECLRSVLATYAWSRLLGGALGISTATERNGSASILRRLGGRSLEWNGVPLPGYFDPHYNCRMHMLRFDSRFPNQRYESAIEQIRHFLGQVLVISPERPVEQVMLPEHVSAIGQDMYAHGQMACAA